MNWPRLPSQMRVGEYIPFTLEGGGGGGRGEEMDSFRGVWVSWSRLSSLGFVDLVGECPYLTGGGGGADCLRSGVG